VISIDEAMLRAKAAGKFPGGITLNEAKAFFGLRTELPTAEWRVAGERPIPPEFRGTGPMLDFQRNAAGVYEMPR
jgi:hypothetical protein